MHRKVEAGAKVPAKIIYVDDNPEVNDLPGDITVVTLPQEGHGVTSSAGQVRRARGVIAGVVRGVICLNATSACVHRKCLPRVAWICGSCRHMTW